MNIVDRYQQWNSSLSRKENVWKRIVDLNYSISREMAPVYTMGSPRPETMRPGRSSIAGTFTMIIDDKKELRNMLKIIEEHGIEIRKNIIELNGNEHNMLYRVEGVDIMNDDSLTMFEQDPWGNTHSFTFVAKNIRIQELS